MTTDIVTKPATDAYREGYDRIFGRARRATAQAIDPHHGELLAETFCQCAACLPMDPFNQRMIVCGKCGNKRCPGAASHLNACSGSNEPGQPGAL